MNLNFWPKMYYSGGGGGGGSGGGGGGASGGGGAAGGGGAGGAGYGGGAGAGGGTGVGGGAAGEQPPEEPTPVGAFRFNTDSYKLEYYDGNQWVNVTTDSDVLQTDGSRMVLAGGLGASSPHKHMIYADVSTTGTTLDFGDMAAGSKTHSMQAGSSRTRGIFSGGYRNNIEFITISSTGDGTDFGDLINYVANTSQAYCSNSTRMLTMGGYNSNPSYAGTNSITKIEINHLGNNQDFGDMAGSASWFLSATASPTRAVFGNTSTSLQYVTISTLGNAAIFGDWGTSPSSIRYGAHGNAVRGIWSGTNPDGTCYYVNIASLGSAIEFGEMTDARNYNEMSGSHTRAVICGGYDSSSKNVMDYAHIMSTGNFVDFGDLQQARGRQAGLSNGHGGL